MKKILLPMITLIALQCTSVVNLKKSNINDTGVFFTGKWLRTERSMDEQFAWVRYFGLRGIVCGGQYQTNRKLHLFHIMIKEGNFWVQLPAGEPGEKPRFLGLKCTDASTDKKTYTRGVDLTKITIQPGVTVLPARTIRFAEGLAVLPDSTAIIGDGKHKQIVDEFLTEFPEAAGLKFHHIKDDAFQVIEIDEPQ
jgi:hypothetical protein